VEGLRFKASLKLHVWTFRQPMLAVKALLADPPLGIRSE
jgi:hypothetical protein